MRWVAILAGSVIVGAIIGTAIGVVVTCAGDGPEFPY